MHRSMFQTYTTALIIEMLHFFKFTGEPTLIDKSMPFAFYGDLIAVKASFFRTDVQRWNKN